MGRQARIAVAWPLWQANQIAFEEMEKGRDVEVKAYDAETYCIRTTGSDGEPGLVARIVELEQ